MLDDPRSAAFAEGFTGQWLDLRKITATAPDARLYPEFDDLLEYAMVQETRLFFDEVLRRDLSVENFVRSDFTMLNDRLAQHYEIRRRGRSRVPPGPASAWEPSRWRADPGERAQGDGQRHHHVAGDARCVGAGPHPGQARAATTAERPGD